LEKKSSLELKNQQTKKEIESINEKIIEEKLQNEQKI